MIQVSFTKTIKIVDYYLISEFPKLYGIEQNDKKTHITLIIPESEVKKAKDIYPLGSIITVEIESTTEWKVIK